MTEDKESKNHALKANEEYHSAVENAIEYAEKFDILETINNVGNDEVFTPRKVCNKMLDCLPEEVWHNPNYKWLNPCSKNGMFEREIAIRLDVGLKDIIPDEIERRKHILRNMIYSIGLTKFTSNVARRTLYYCSQANRQCDGIKAEDGHYVNGYAIGNGTWFDREEGNVLTPCTEHVFGSYGKCIYCGVSNKSRYVDSKQREQYVYEFIHIDSDKLLEHLQDRFFKGDRNMKFDIIIGNPPYQLNDGGAQASARPIYQLFIEQAKSLEPKYICMITPSRWMTGGKGLDKFRLEMIKDTKISNLYDYIDASDVFPNVDIKGGVSYFLIDRDYEGECHIYSHTSNGVIESTRKLNSGDDIFIRDARLLQIKNKVAEKNDKWLNAIVSARKPYGLEAETMYNAHKYHLPAFSDTPIDGGYTVLGLNESQKRTFKYIPADYPLPKNKNDTNLNKYKVFIAEAYGSGIVGEVPSNPVLGRPGELCTETFLEIGPFPSELEAGNMIKYIKTRFFRLLVGILKQTQHTTQKVYRFVPQQIFGENSDIDWAQPVSEIDKQLYSKYNLSEQDIDFIETEIKAME